MRYPVFGIDTYRLRYYSFAMHTVEEEMNQRLGWHDATFKADGETYVLEMEVVGRLEKKWMGEKPELVVTAVNIYGADVKVNILPILSPAQVRAIASEVRGQASLRNERPDFYKDVA